MRGSRIAGLLCLVLAGCGGPPAGTVFEATLAQPDGSSAMPVILGDRTGLVRSIAPATGGPGGAFDQLSIATDPADPNTLLVTWITGMCEDNTTISFIRLDAGFGLYLYVNGGIGFGGCPAAALTRELRVTLSEPVAPGTITRYYQA